MKLGFWFLLRKKWVFKIVALFFIFENFYIWQFRNQFILRMNLRLIFLGQIAIFKVKILSFYGIILSFCFMTFFLVYFYLRFLFLKNLFFYGFFVILKSLIRQGRFAIPGVLVAPKSWYFHRITKQSCILRFSKLDFHVVMAYIDVCRLNLRILDTFITKNLPIFALFVSWVSIFLLGTLIIFYISKSKEVEMCWWIIQCI